MRNLVPTSRSGMFIAAALLVAAAIAVRERPSGTIGPIPGDPVNGVVPNLAFIAALLVAIITTTAGAVSLAKKPRTTGERPKAPDWEKSDFQIRRTYLLLAVVALILSMAIVTMMRPGLDPEQVSPSTPTENEPGEGVPPTPPEDLPEPDPANPTFSLFVLLIVAAISLVILIAAWRTVRRQPRTTDEEREGQYLQPTVEPLIHATELALQEVKEPDRPPRDAIIACFATMEHALENTEFAPRESDTAKEVIDRAVSHEFMPTEPAETLRSLFTEARFSPHEMTDQHRDRAKSALNNALEGLKK